MLLSFSSCSPWIEKNNLHTLVWTGGKESSFPTSLPIKTIPHFAGWWRSSNVKMYLLNVLPKTKEILTSFPKLASEHNTIRCSAAEVGHAQRFGRWCCHCRRWSKHLIYYYKNINKTTHVDEIDTADGWDADVVRLPFCGVERRHQALVIAVLGSIKGAISSETSEGKHAWVVLGGFDCSDCGKP